MAEYITKDTVISLFEKWSDGYAYIEIPVQDAIRQVSAIPPADVRPVVRGKWEEVEVTWLADVEDQPDAIASMFCPVCKRFANHVYHYGNPCYGMNFCPHCGARMGGDAK